ncbi:SRPBCC family protein [Amycolatopsis sp. FDAARGOS 1241]|uniref:SRPBCC family protein n=1 Tax=Amycolatopsis sp. FDAARGOS 1241 TaxID=2778070 RepID=UPI00194EFAE1|nr:SRPBCC family protein [Amycolatopsis sp. FDAARGOS 1241]QRP50428.1 SRPBCC family protein [Amycolatopsis sp. FDAARGOS 1241]QRP50501.1 SRPBCC family protein [Amycolatopsis sp. FDAARGOS 1241]
MPRPYASGVVAAPVDKVWTHVRAFGDLPAFLTAIGQCQIVEGTDGQVGAVRRLTLATGGDPFDERLLALDDPTHTLTYTFTGANPFGVRRYTSTLRLSPITDTGDTFVEWWAEYDADASQEEQLNHTFAHDVYATGIDGLRQLLA